jgi:hypothetical protein
VYDEQFFKLNQQEGLAMAHWFMPALERTFGFRSLVDVGCGTGHYVQWCHDHNLNACGIEGSRWACEHPLVRDVILWADLRTESVDKWKGHHFDLALCIEVAEHIEPEYADNLITLLTSLSDTVVFTAAPPGQGGTCHVNEQPEEYWENKFNAHGLVFSSEDTIALRKAAEDAKRGGMYVTNWMMTNLVVYKKELVAA